MRRQHPGPDKLTAVVPGTWKLAQKWARLLLAVFAADGLFACTETQCDRRTRPHLEVIAIDPDAPAPGRPVCPPDSSYSLTLTPEGSKDEAGALEI